VSSTFIVCVVYKYIPMQSVWRVPCFRLYSLLLPKCTN